MTLFFLVFSFALSFATCVGFLLNNTGLPAGGATSLSDKHFVTLVDMITEEKQARRQLEQYVVQQNKELASMKDQLNKQVAPNGNDSLLNGLLVEQNETKLMKETIQKMRIDYHVLQEENRQLTSNNQKLISEVNILKNETIELQTDFKQWKSSVIGLQVSNITYVSEKFKTTDAKLNSLVISNNARVQDFLAMLNQTKVSTSRINVLETAQLGISSKLNLLARNQNSTDNKLEAAISKMNEKVALTSCAQSRTGSGNVRFPHHKTTFGIKNISDFDRTGIFTCENEGLYLISVYILSDTSEADFYVVVNGNFLTDFYVKGNDGGGGNYNTGTAVLVVSLKKNDRVSIRTESNDRVYGDPYSCLTILKIK